MLYNHFTEELLGLQGVKVTNVEKEDRLFVNNWGKEIKYIPPRHIFKTENRLILVEAGCYSNAANQFLKLIKIFLNRSPHP